MWLNAYVITNLRQQIGCNVPDLVVSNCRKAPPWTRQCMLHSELCATLTVNWCASRWPSIPQTQGIPECTLVQGKIALTLRMPRLRFYTAILYRVYVGQRSHAKRSRLNASAISSIYMWPYVNLYAHARISLLGNGLSN